MKDKPENDVVYVKPPKPISEMSDEEIDEFVNTVWLSVSEGEEVEETTEDNPENDDQ